MPDRDEPHDLREPDELTDAERARLDAWEPAAPPPDFAARAIAAAAGAGLPPRAQPAAPPPRRRGPLVAVALASALAAAAATWVVARPAAPARAAEVAGARQPTAREQLRLGARGVAVAEAGASLAWHVDADGAARVDQAAGDVFYRVEPGGPFVVATPAGDVRVTGTCFRVEVHPMKPSKSSLVGAAIGAALAATVVVSVYEGGVVVAGKDGGEERVSAGERVVLGGPGGASPTVLAAAEPPPPDATRDQLLARDAAQRETIQQLVARVAGLERQVASGRGGKQGGAPPLPRPGEPDDGDGRPFFDPSPELLAQFAAECRVRVDLPPVDQSSPLQLNAAQAAELGLELGELDAVNAALRTIHQRWLERLIVLYVEATGDAAGAESLSPMALGNEIMDKAIPGEAQRIRARMARERAGLLAPPADLSQTSPVERYLRAEAKLGDEMEALLAESLGPERARALRAADGGWGMRKEMSGCPDDEGEGEAAEVTR